MSMDTNNTPKTISGIDTLYYFYETNDIYDDLFLDILDQVEEIKSRYKKRDIKYENKDIRILINQQAFIFNGKSQGFYWFTHIDAYLTIGFKDYMTNRGLNDIQVQLSAVGIYTLGLKSLIQYIDILLAKYITGYKPLTRVDLNIFVQSNLSWIDKEMFVARKRIYTSIFKEIANKHQLQTIYIGKKPFLLRIYNKTDELRQSKKVDLMVEYFATNGFTSMDNIFNIEFEMHRDYFKTFKIDTVDDLLQRAELLFKDCLNAIRLINLSSITDNTKDSKNKNRAETHLLWEHLANSYKLKDFLSIEVPLERVKRKSYSYTIEEALKELVATLRKFYIHNGIVDEQLMDEALQMFKTTKEYNFSNDKNANIIDIHGYEIIYEDINQTVNPKQLSTLELEKYVHKLEADMSFPDLDIHLLIKQYKIASVELTHRKKMDATL